jgi:hypothetical protein
VQFQKPMSKNVLIYAGCLGDDGMTEYNWRLAKPPKSKPQKDFLAESKISEEVKKFFRIYFPTHETVAKSKGGLGVSIYNVKVLPYMFRPQPIAKISRSEHINLEDLSCAYAGIPSFASLSENPSEVYPAKRGEVQPREHLIYHLSSICWYQLMILSLRLPAPYAPNHNGTTVTSSPRNSCVTARAVGQAC